jgi:hypothetical protein
LRADEQGLRRSEIEQPGPGIVHLGLGAFFRAFGAIYVDDAVRLSGGDWGIIGVSLQSPVTRDRLAQQDFVYTVVTQDADGDETFRKVEIVQDVLVAPESPEAVLTWMADPAIRIVTLTVTEKGYCHDPATGNLNLDHPDIIHDLENPSAEIRAGLSGPGAATAARCRAAALHRADLRQPSGERQAGSPCGAGSCRPDRSGACRLDCGRRPVSGDDGRPDHAGDEARGYRAAGAEDRLPG